MGAAKGSVVMISFTCRLEDGTPFDLEQRTLRAVAGEGTTLPALEQGVVGMEPGERRTVAVPAAEVNEFLRKKAHAAPAAGEHRPGFGYDFGPGEGGDVLLTIPHPPGKQPREVPRGTERVIFEVTVAPVQPAAKKQ